MDRDVAEKNRMQFSKICWLATEVEDDGSLSPKYKESDNYKNSELVGDVYGFCAGPLEIHKGIIGMTADEIVVAVRGTDGAMDGMNDLRAQGTDFEGMGIVHAGFAGAAKSLLSIGMESVINELLKNNPEMGLCFTGHSKGGAVAFLLAAHYRQYSSRIRVITFEAARVGDRVFAESYKQSKLETWRYEDFLDIVAHVPFTAQEHKLLDRMGPVCNFLENLTNLVAFDTVPVGTRVGFYVGHPEYNGKYPHNEGNGVGESLNSMCAIEYLLRNCSVRNLNSLVQDIHNNDFDAKEVEYVDF